MTEQEVTHFKGKQAPDPIIMRTCGTATPNPFPCKVHVYRRGLWAEGAVVVPQNVSRCAKIKGAGLRPGK
jgi:hypothetical protein